MKAETNLGGSPVFATLRWLTSGLKTPAAQVAPPADGSCQGGQPVLLHLSSMSAAAAIQHLTHQWPIEIGMLVPRRLLPVRAVRCCGTVQHSGFGSENCSEQAVVLPSGIRYRRALARQGFPPTLPLQGCVLWFGAPPRRRQRVREGTASIRASGRRAAGKGLATHRWRLKAGLMRQVAAAVEQSRRSGLERLEEAHSGAH